LISVEPETFPIGSFIIEFPEVGKLYGKATKLNEYPVTGVGVDDGVGVTVGVSVLVGVKVLVGDGVLVTVIDGVGVGVAGTCDAVGVGVGKL
jgi:hypothetical protein